MRNLFQKSFLRKLFFSYLIILAFALCIGLFLFTFSMRRIEEDTLRFSQISLEQVSESVTRMKEDVYSLTLSISIRSEYRSLLYSDSELTAYKRQNVADLQKEMLQLVSATNYISSIYIWFEEPQIAATTIGMLKGSESMNRTLEDHFGISLDEIREVAELNSSSVFLYGSEGYAEKAYMLVAGGYGADRSIFIIELNLAFLKGLLSAGNENEGFFWAISSQNGLLMAPDSVSEMALALSGYSLSDTDITRVSFNGNNYALLSNGENDSFLLVSAVDYQSYRQTIVMYTRVFLLFLMVSLVMGGALSFYLSHNNYQPIQDICDKVSEFTSETDNGNDFVILETGIQSLLQRTKDYDQINSQAKRYMRDNFLSSLLLGTFTGDFQESCVSFGLKFSSENFMVIGIAVRGYDNLFMDPFFSQNGDVALHSIYSVVAERLGKTYTVAVCQYEKRIWAIVSLSPDDTISDLEELCAAMERFLREDLGIFTWMYLSNVFSYLGASGISRAYLDALWGLEQEEAYNMEIPVQNEKSIRLHIDHAFNAIGKDQSQKQQEMLQAAIRGDYAEADRLYLEIRQQYTQYSFSLVRAQTMIFIDYMVSFLPTAVVVEHSVVIQNYRNHIYHETRDQQLIDLMHSFMICFHDIYQTIPQQTSDKMGSLALSAAQYINEHYTDSGIGVTQVAEQFSVSTSYLSKAFQKTYDIGIPDYIHQRRLNTACILLKEKNITIETIAAHVGYTNSLALIRAFRKYKKCTPTEYRSTYTRTEQG